MSKYRRENDPENGECDNCGAPIWSRDGVYTSYHGKGHYWDSLKKTEACSYDVLVEHDGRIDTGIICPKCWNDYEKES